MRKLALTVSYGLRNSFGRAGGPDKAGGVRATARRPASGERDCGRHEGVAAGGVATSESPQGRGPRRRAQRRGAANLFGAAGRARRAARLARQFLGRCFGRVQAGSGKILSGDEEDKMSERVAIAPVRKTVHVKAPIDHAFAVFTSGLTRWWPHDHGVGRKPIAKVMMEL